ncbi:hypothetical protein UXO72_23655 [Enterobacter hormaechei]
MSDILFGIIAVGVGLYIMNELDERAGEQRRRWDYKREEVKRTIEEHQGNVELYFQNRNAIYNFHILVDKHYSCMQVANEAYSLLKDAKVVSDSTYDAINKLKTHRNNLFENKKSANNSNDKRIIQEEINLIGEMIKELYDDLNKNKLEKDDLYKKVKDFNAKTRALKLTIRDQTGQKGYDWYTRLEHRSAMRS